MNLSRSLNLAVGFAAAAVAAGCDPPAPPDCSPAAPWTSDGLATWTVYAAGQETGDGEGGAPAAAAGGTDVGGAATLTVSVSGYEHGLFDGNTGSYCGPTTFPITLGSDCVLTATIDYVNYSPSSYGRGASFLDSHSSITSGQSCALTTDAGSVAVLVSSGAFATTPGAVTLQLVGTTTAASGEQVVITFNGDD